MEFLDFILQYEDQLVGYLVTTCSLTFVLTFIWIIQLLQSDSNFSELNIVYNIVSTVIVILIHSISFLLVMLCPFYISLLIGFSLDLSIITSIISLLIYVISVIVFIVNYSHDMYGYFWIDTYLNVLLVRYGEHKQLIQGYQKDYQSLINKI